MARRHHFSTPSECASLLDDVLSCLDELAAKPSVENSDHLTLAAAHVQQALELIQTTEDPDP